MTNDDGRTIVVGVDGSPQSAAALRWALGEAGERDEIRAVLVAAPSDLLPGTSSQVPRAVDYGAHLHATVEAVRAGEPGRAHVRELVLTGDPARELIRASAAADLLVVGSHGTRPLSRLLIGSVATQCVRHAQCPVVVMPPATARG